MNDVLHGFEKAAGFGSFMSGAVSKVKSFFGGGAARHLGDASSSVGAQTLRLGRRAAAPVAKVAPAVPKMSLIRGSGSVAPMKMNAPTPTSLRNTAIRSEMKQGLREGWKP